MIMFHFTVFFRVAYNYYILSTSFFHHLNKPCFLTCADPHESSRSHQGGGGEVYVNKSPVTKYSHIHWHIVLHLFVVLLFYIIFTYFI